MPSNIPTGFAQATIVFDHEGTGENVVVTLGVSMAAWTAPIEEAPDHIFRAWADSYLDHQDNGITLTHVDLFIGAGDSPSGSVRSTLPPEPGGTSMVSIPLNSAVIVNKNTSSLGRRGRGRMFVPSMVAASNVSETGLISSTPLASYNTAGEEFLGGLLGEDVGGGGYLPPVILHRPPHQTDPPSIITSFTAQARIGTRGSRIR